MTERSADDRIDAYLVCGGRWHDFDYARLQLLTLLGEDERIRVRVAEDYSDLHAITNADFLVSYTCDKRPTEEQQLALERYVREGGRWLALHGTNSAIERYPDGFATPRILGPVAKVLGSQFIAHPPIQPFTVEVTEPDHPLVSGIEPFETDDELYLCELHDAEEHQLLMHTRWHGNTGPGFLENDWPDDDPRPVVYLRPYGEGSVLYNTLGHCRGHWDMQPMIPLYPQIERGSWEQPAYHELLRRSIRWATGDLAA
ncbi:MAG: ThuA domain-containing protein [Actinomycetota bacterium]